MSKLIFTFILSFGLFSNVLAINWFQLCEDLPAAQEACDENHDPFKLKKLEKSLIPLQLSAIAEESIEGLKTSLQKDIDNEKYFFRSMRGLKYDQKVPNHQEKYAKRKERFLKLLKIIEKEKLYQDRLDVCYQVQCTRNMERDNLENLQYFQSLKVLFLIKNPTLATDKVSQLIEKNDPPTDEEIRKALVHSSSTYLTQRQDLISELSQLSRALEENNGDKTTLEIFEEFPLGMEAFYHQLNKDPNIDIEESKAPLCAFHNFRINYLYKEKIVNFGAQAGLFLGPLMIPPLRGLKVGRTIYLATFGTKSSKAARSLKAWSLATGVEAAGAFSHISQIHRDCKRNHTQFMINGDGGAYESVTRCEQELADAKFYALLSQGATLGVLGVPSLIKAFPKAKKAFDKNPYITFKSIYTPQTTLEGLKKSNIPEHASKSALILKTDRGDFTTYLDLEKAAAKGQDHSSITSRYWKYVGDVYSKRLKLSDDEVKGFIKSSEEMEDRTKIILRTKSNPAIGPPDFNGGVGIVLSRNTDELLPLEKATSFRVPRKEGERVHEVVRLVATDDTNPRLMHELAAQIGTILRNDQKADKFFVYTSKVHERLYRRLGIPYKIIEKPNKRDVIMEFDLSNINELDILTKGL